MKAASARRISRPPVLPPRGALVHCVGVCGTGMAPLALSLAAAGWRVSGEDQAWPAEVAQWLQAGGVARTATGELPAQAGLVIHSSAVPPSHPTRAAATGRGVPALRRGEALAALLRGRPLIAVVGSHGKTTSTAMLAWALRAAGIECDHLLGGLYADGQTPPARWSGEGWVVAEIDESDGTIGGFSPEITLCVNVDWDHCDQYADPAAIEAAFAALAARTQRAIFFSSACALSPRVFAAAPTQAVRYSFGPDGDFSLLEATGREDGQMLRLGGKFVASEARVAAAGAFNARNATGALAVACWLGGDASGDLLADYPGVRRRQAAIETRPDVTVIEDYAHHPAEIEALLEAMRARGPRRLVAVFQPHRFSRTRAFKAGFARALSRADRVFLLEVYPAGEKPLDGGRTADLLALLQGEPSAPPAELLDAASAPRRIAEQASAGDLIVFVGAGDIEDVAHRTAALMRETPPGAGDSRAALVRALDRALAPDTLVRAGEPLGPKTTMHVGGKAELYAEPANTADLQALLVAARAAGVPVLLLGRGSNVIVPDDGVRGLVIRLQHPHWRRFVALGPDRYWAGAGLRLKELCGIACRLGESGFEFLDGIPGTVGGALRMNAGAMGGWMFDLVEQVHLLAPDGSLHIATRDELHVDYRRCEELEGAIALGAVLRPGGHAASTQIRSRMDGFQQTRHASQPREPSAGCIFKNPPGDSAGRIIDELGLKGLRVGDAEVSLVHANFIVNRGQATGADVIALVRRVRDEVRQRRRIDLEPEVMLYGREWKEVL